MLFWQRKRFKIFWRPWTYPVKRECSDVIYAWKWLRIRETCDGTWSWNMPNQSPTIVHVASKFFTIDITCGITSASAEAKQPRWHQLLRLRCPERVDNHRRIMPKNYTIFSTHEPPMFPPHFRSAWWWQRGCVELSATNSSQRGKKLQMLTVWEIEQNKVECQATHDFTPYSTH